ncbi:acyltransferase family protein [Prosthecobacter sp.]|uniref:acyltransferase family protein n=1 Tax=Prosthecobacter sp. TaxID=1965333 RepID=UPI0037849879
MPAPSTIAKPLQLSLLDACRGGAALWVVMAHACLAYIATGHEEMLSNPLYAFSVRGQIGVGFFFAISGYCILATIFNGMRRCSTLREYLVARCRRIYPPYLVALGCVVLTHLAILFMMSKGIMAGARPPESPLDHGISYWFANLTLVQLPAGYSCFLFVSWSLCYEIAFYAVAGILWALSSLGGRDGPRPALLVSLLNLCSLVSVAWVAVSKGTCPFPLNLWYQFGLGIALFVLVNRKEMHLARFLQAQAVVVILAVFVHALNLSPEPAANLYHSDRTQVFCVIGFVMLLTALARFDRALSGGWLMLRLRWLGTISYSLYLIHMLPMPVVDALLRRAGLQGSLYLITYAAQIIVAVIAGSLFHHLVEKRFFETKKHAVSAAPMQCQPSA